MEMFFVFKSTGTYRTQTIHYVVHCNKHLQFTMYKVLYSVNTIMLGKMLVWPLAKRHSYVEMKSYQFWGINYKHLAFRGTIIISVNNAGN